jgi:hypothetical protein
LGGGGGGVRGGGVGWEAARTFSETKINYYTKISKAIYLHIKPYNTSYIVCYHHNKLILTGRSPIFDTST